MIKNKICSLLLILLGLMTVPVDGDATILALMLIIAVPMFFSKESWFYES